MVSRVVAAGESESGDIGPEVKARMTMMSTYICGGLRLLRFQRPKWSLYVILY